MVWLSVKRGEVVEIWARDAYFLGMGIRDDINALLKRTEDLRIFLATLRQFSRTLTPEDRAAIDVDLALQGPIALFKKECNCAKLASYTDNVDLPDFEEMVRGLTCFSSRGLMLGQDAKWVSQVQDVPVATSADWDSESEEWLEEGIF